MGRRYTGNQRLEHNGSMRGMRDTASDTQEIAKWDPAFTKQVIEAAGPVIKRWHRAEVRNLDKVPAAGGALVVSNHSGGMFTPDVIGHHQRSTGRRDFVEVSDLGAMPPLDYWSGRLDDLFCERRIPFGDFLGVGCRVPHAPHAPVVLEPLIAGVTPTHRGLYTYRDIWYSLFWRTPYPLVVQSATQLF